MKAAPRLLVCAAVMVLGILSLAPAALARSHAGPTIVPRVATFTIPTGGPPLTEWTLNVWKRGTLIGSDTGTVGVLSVTVPRTVEGTVQADVSRNGRWYSGNRVALPGSGGGGSGTGGGSGSHGGGGGKHGHGGGNGSHGAGNGSGPGSEGGSGSSPTTTTTIAPATTGAGGSSGTGNSGGTGTGTRVGGTNGQVAGAPGTSGVANLHQVDPITLAVGDATPARSAALAFTGAGDAFWSTALAGLGLAFLGFFVLMRRREAKAARS
jgi:hypothetical protein